MKFSNFDQISPDKLLMNGEFFISLSKIKGKIQAYHLFNMRYVAVYQLENDKI